MRLFGRRLGRLLKVVLAGYGITLFGVVAIEGFWPRGGAPVQADAIICLGGGAFADGLAPDSRNRAQRCVDLFHADAAPMILFSGATAAPLMADLATEEGVPATAIGVEGFSRSTLQNALFSGRLIDMPTDQVIVVSNAYHLPRAWVSFRVMGFDGITLVAVDEYVTRPRPLLREPLAIWFNIGRAAFWMATPWMDPDIREGMLE